MLERILFKKLSFLIEERILFKNYMYMLKLTISAAF